jgi:hypothetical protein
MLKIFGTGPYGKYTEETGFSSAELSVSNAAAH